MTRIKLVLALCVCAAFPILPVFAQQTHEVETQDNVFTPEGVTIKAGETITFVNTGNLPHTATARDNSWDTGNINSGESRSITFQTAGTIDYYCKYHEALGMVGTIVVEQAGAPAASPSPATPSPSPEGEAAAAAAPEEIEDINAGLPVGLKLFPFVAFAMLAGAVLAIFAGYVRTVQKSTEVE